MGEIIKYVIEIGNNRFSGAYRIKSGVEIETGLYIILKILKSKIPDMVKELKEVDKRAM